MSFRYPQPSNEDDFELFCLRLLRELWQCPTLQQYGKRGERQDGIDLIDEAGGSPLRAVQCKHHESDKTIPPKEIEDEVAKALKSGFPLDEYYVLTSARKSAQGQKAVVQLNRAHQAAGHFKVSVWTWADIEERLSQLDDTAQERVLRGDSGRSGPALCKMLTGVVADHLDRPLYASASVLDHELEAIKSHLDRHEPEVAECKLKELESRAPDKLQPHHWYQLKALRSKLYSDRWEWEKAGRELLDAKRFTPDTERARINEALGRELVGEREKAHALATALRSEYALSVRLLSIWVRTAPDDLPFDTVVRTAGHLAKDDEELNLALALRALAAERFDEAAPYASRATELDTDSPHAWFLLGQVMHAQGYKPAAGLDRNRLGEAEAHYDRAVKLAHEHKLPGLEAAIRLNRGKVRHVLGGRNADADFAAACELARPGEGVRTEYVSYLLEVGRSGDALDELSRETGEPTTARLFYEAAARHERNVGDDRKRAVELLKTVIARPPGDRWTHAHVFLVQYAVAGKTLDDAKAVISGSKLPEVDPLLHHTLNGWLAESEGKSDVAKTEYEQAHALVTDTTPRDHLFLLTQALAACGQHDLALPLFLRAYRPGIFDLECRKLLACARHLEQHDVSVRVCRELRQAGVNDPRIIQTELDILQLYDPHAALRLAQDYLAAHAENRHVALWQSALALRLDRRDLVISDAARLPNPDEVTPHGCGLVVNVLAETEQHAAALRYAYDALREHFDAEFAHGQFIAWFHELADHCPEIRIGGTARPGTAVCYREEREESDRWLVIEDGADPDLAHGEYAPDHALSRALTGHKVGETVVVTDGGIQPRKVTIREAFHKYIYRFRDCLNQFQVRFSGATAIQLINVGSATGDGFDFTPIIRGLEDQRKRVEELDEMYRTQPLPLYTYAALAGHDEFEAWGHLASAPSRGLRCWDERVDDLRGTLEAAGQSKTVVVDLTALHTLARLDILKVLAGTTRTFAVSQTTFDRLQHLTDRAEEDRGEGGFVTLTETGGLGFIPAAPEQKKQYAAFLGTIRDAVREHCQILPCPQAAGLEPERRERYVQTIGRHNLDSLLLAAAPGTVLWSDDLILGLVGRAEFRAGRAWTQAVLFVLRQEGAITARELDQAVAKLVGWHYNSTRCGAETLVAAAEVAEWDSARWPVPQVMQTLGNDAANPVHRLTAAAAAIREIWRRDLPDHARQGFMFALLLGIRSVRLIERLARLLPPVFGLDVISAYEAVGLIRYWLQHPTGLVRP